MQGTIFDYFVDEQSCSMMHWDTKVSPFTYQPDNFAGMFVSTVESTKIRFLLDLLMGREHYVMLVGNTGDYIIHSRCKRASDLKA